MAWARERKVSDGSPISPATTAAPRSDEVGRNLPLAARRPPGRGPVRAQGWRVPGSTQAGQGHLPRVRENHWLPSRHVELSTRQSYVSYHFNPFLGDRQLSADHAVAVQAWVTKVTTEGLSPGRSRRTTWFCTRCSGGPYATGSSPSTRATETELPKMIARQSQTLTPEEYARLYAEIPERYRTSSRPASRPASAGASSPASARVTSTSSAARSPSRRPSSRSPRSTPPPASATSSSRTRRTTSLASSAFASRCSTASPPASAHGTRPRRPALPLPRSALLSHATPSAPRSGSPPSSAPT